jgi:hypothetical protein
MLHLANAVNHFVISQTLDQTFNKEANRWRVLFDCICAAGLVVPYRQRPPCERSSRDGLPVYAEIRRHKKRANVLKDNRSDLDALNSYLATWETPFELNREVRQVANDFRHKDERTLRAACCRANVIACMKKYIENK